ncbi:hypothetical protein ACVZDL_16630 [Escherichia coli]
MKFFTSDPVALYNTEITSTVPDSAVEISDDQYATLIAGQEMGKSFQLMKMAFPVLLNRHSRRKRN